MTINITWPTDQDVEVVDAIRAAIGRETIWYIVASSIPCPVCNLDPITNTSTDSFCETCQGAYYIPTYSGVSISGHINWGYSEQLGWVSGGQLDEGECRVQIKYTPDNLSTVNNAKYVTVDGKKMDIVKRVYRGVKTLNRILVDLQEDEEEGEGMV